MAGFFERLDRLAGIDRTRPAVLWLERTAFVFLLVMTVSAPHSIAGAQASWLIGILATAIRLAMVPRPRFRFRALDIALFSLFIWAVVSSVLSYEPAISLDKLRGVSLFLVFYFAYLNIRRLRTVCCIAFLLILSCMVNVGWVIGERIVGRGIEVYGVSPEGPLGKAGVMDADTLLTVNGEKIRSADELSKKIGENEAVKIRVYRPEAYLVFDVNRADLQSGGEAESLGIRNWTTGHNWRAQGFFGHFTTYAELLQLIASLLFGLIIASIAKRKFVDLEDPGTNGLLRFLSSSVVMVVALAAMLVALLLTVTRASQLAFMVSAFSIIVVSGSRKLLIAAGLIAVPVVLGGLLFLQQSRNIGFVDTRDESTLYRLTMWRDGLRLSTASAHNLVFGIGMDSKKRHWQEWGMFDGGRLPMGHFHSTPVQLLVERGVPSLLIWLSVLAIYAMTLWRAIRRKKHASQNGETSPWALGVLLGCFGGLAGFFVSGLVHYNLGDGEVAMVFYLLMALGVRTAELLAEPDNDEAVAARNTVRMAA